jgi:hypothetical protein
LPASKLCYPRNFGIEKGELLPTLWVNGLSQNIIPLTQRAIAAKARSRFDENQQKKMAETRYSMLTNDGLQGSSKARRLIE